METPQEPTPPEASPQPEPRPPRWMLRRKERQEKRILRAKALVARAVEVREDLHLQRELLDELTRLETRLGLPPLAHQVWTLLARIPSSKSAPIVSPLASAP